MSRKSILDPHQEQIISMWEQGDHINKISIYLESQGLSVSNGCIYRFLSIKRNGSKRPHRSAGRRMEHSPLYPHLDVMVQMWNNGNSTREITSHLLTLGVHISEAAVKCYIKKHGDVEKRQLGWNIVKTSEHRAYNDLKRKEHFDLRGRP